MVLPSKEFQPQSDQIKINAFTLDPKVVDPFEGKMANLLPEGVIDTNKIDPDDCGGVVEGTVTRFTGC